MNHIAFSQIPQGLMESMLQTEKYINNLNFDRPLLELVRYYVSVLNGCAYCVDMHYKEAIASDISPQRLYSISVWRETNFYSDSEQALLEWTEFVTKLTEPSDKRKTLLNQLSVHFSVEEIANLTLVITQMNAWNRLAKPFNFQPGTYEVGQH